MTNLPQVLASVDWKANINAAFDDKSSLGDLEAALMRIAVWSKQLENCDGKNPAICFIREMQAAAQQGAALIGLCLYKASAASIRTVLEASLYYTYFRTHPSELSSLIRVDKYFIRKSEIIDYHRVHTPKFMEYQELFGLLGNLEQWYSKVSAIVHGQIPGAWNEHSSLSEIGFSAVTHKLALEKFLSGEKLTHEILLCTAGKTLWSGFATDTKKFLIKGMPGEKREALGLDSA